MYLCRTLGRWPFGWPNKVLPGGDISRDDRFDATTDMPEQTWNCAERSLWALREVRDSDEHVVDQDVGDFRRLGLLVVVAAEYQRVRPGGQRAEIDLEHLPAGRDKCPAIPVADEARDVVRAGGARLQRADPHKHLAELVTLVGGTLRQCVAERERN